MSLGGMSIRQAYRRAGVKYEEVDLQALGIDSESVAKSMLVRWCTNCLFHSTVEIFPCNNFFHRLLVIILMARSRIPARNHCAQHHFCISRNLDFFQHNTTCIMTRKRILRPQKSIFTGKPKVVGPRDLLRAMGFSDTGHVLPVQKWTPGADAFQKIQLIRSNYIHMHMQEN
jgi:hypothetical protein